MTPFHSLPDYESFVYTLPQQFSSIERSTLTVARRGRLYAELSGEVTFAAGVRLSIYERLLWDTSGLTSRATATKPGWAAISSTGTTRNPTLTTQR
jgi:hypothetical protein